MTKKVSPTQLLSYFPEVELPITISDELASVAAQQNDILPSQIIDDFILKWEEDEIDEFTEFVACLKIGGLTDFNALIYWKGGLLRYEYFLVTLDKQGNKIGRKPIASTIIEGNVVKKSVAQIDEDLIIHIMAGATFDGASYDPSASKAFNMEVLPNGEIIFALGD